MSKRLGTNKDIEKLARRARKQGWEVQITRNNHLKFINPDGAVVVGGLTACSSGVKKFQFQLKKAGLQ